MRTSFWKKVARSLASRTPRRPSSHLRLDELESRLVPYNVTDPWGTSTISYSYSNLLDGTLRDTNNVPLSRGDLIAATEEAMGVWSAYAALAFYALPDSGPLPTSSDDDYDRANHPTIRWGHHYIDGPGNVGAHVGDFPGGDGEDGDVHFDSGDRISITTFLEVAAHELGHAVGMLHADGVIMHAVLRGGGTWAYNGLGSAYLLPDDIAGIRSLYGAGLGYVLDINGTMHVYGTQGSDTFIVSTSGNNIQITNVTTGGTLDRSMNGIRGIAIHGRGGNDLFDVIRAGGLSLTLHGEGGDDSFRVAGDVGGDVLIAGGTKPDGTKDDDRVSLNIHGLSARLTDTALTSGRSRIVINSTGETEALEISGNTRTNLAVAGTPTPANTLFDIGTVDVQQTNRALTLVRPRTVVIGNNGDASGIAGAVAIERGTYVDLRIDDSASTTSRNFALSRNELTGLPATVRWTDHVVFNSFQVNGGRGDRTTTGFAGNDVQVMGSPSTLVKLNTGEAADRVQVVDTGGAVEINGQNGEDRVVVGFNGRVQGLRGNLTITNARSFSTVIVDDSKDTQSRTVLLYRQSPGRYNVISGLSPFGDILLKGSDLRSLSVSLGNAGNTVRVHDTPRSATTGGLTTTIRTGNGNDTVTVNGTSGGLAVDLQQGGFQQITIGSAATGMDRIQGQVTVGGAGGTNSVTLTDSTSHSSQTLTHTLTNNSYTRSGAARVNLGDVYSLTLQTGAAADTVQVQGNPTSRDPSSNFSVSTGNGGDTINLGTAAHQLGGIGAVTIDAGGPNSDDMLNIYDDGTTSPTTYTFDLASGDPSSPVVTSPDATAIYRNVESMNFFGGSGDDTVLVRALPTTTVAIDPGSGNDTVDVGTAADQLGAIASLRISDSAGVDQVILRDQGESTPRFYSRDAARIVAQPLSGAGPTARFTILGIESTSLYGGSAGDSFRIASTFGGPLAAYGGEGDDLFIVGSYEFYDIFTDQIYPANSLGRIASPVLMDGQGGTDSLSFNDQGSTTGQAYSITTSTLRRTDTAVMTHANMEGVTINGSAADDTFRMGAPGGGAYNPPQALNGNGGVNTVDYSAYAGGTSGPASWYQADETFVDSAGGNTGTPHNGVSFGPGHTGQAFAFDGVDDYIDLGNDATLNMPGSTTFEAWINHQAYENSVGYKYLLGDFDESGTVSQGSLGLLGARLFWYQSMTDGTSIQPTGSTDLIAGQWYHVAVVRDDLARTVKIYVNGVEDASETYTGTVVDLQSSKSLGTSIPVVFTEDFFAGSLDEVAFYDRALTAAEVHSHHAGAGDTLAAAATGVTVNLVLGTATGLGNGISNIQNVVGGAGDDILVGNGGNRLDGGPGRDLLIAGGTPGILLGGGGEDLLIGGSTVWDGDSGSLAAMHAEWTRTDADSAERAGILRQGYLSAGNLTGNGGGNTLTGGNDLDVFFADISLDTLDAGDWEVVIPI